MMRRTEENGRINQEAKCCPLLENKQINRVLVLENKYGGEVKHLLSLAHKGKHDRI